MNLEPIIGIAPVESGRWEYKMEDVLGGVSGLTERWLNEQGSRGWELAAAHFLTVGDRWRCIFKRPRGLRLEALAVEPVQVAQRSQ